MSLKPSSLMTLLVAAGLLALAQPATPAIIPPDRATTWNPGIPGGIPSRTSVWVPSGNPFGGYSVDPALGNGTTNAAPAINAAIQSAGNAAASTGVPKVVLLAPGTYRATSTIVIERSHVVLRGSGAASTRLNVVVSGAVRALTVGILFPNYDAGDVTTLSTDAAKGAVTITVASAAGFQVGDVIQIDQLDDTSYVRIGDCEYWKRGPGGEPNSSGFRSVGQTNQITAINGTTFTLRDPIHIAFKTARTAQVFRSATTRPGEWGTTDVGVEDLAITGAGGGTANIEIANTSYSWVKNVESDGDPAWGSGTDGHHIRLVRSYRCEIRGNYVHHAQSISPGGGAYGITINEYSSANLIEDNIVYMLNKPLAVNVSGGGNVIGYNYADQAIIDYAPQWQETGLDANHCSFSHSDLFEGNWTPNLGGDTTHGNSGWQTFFRNHGRGRNSDNVAYQNVHGANATGWSRYYNYVGNVLLYPNPPTLQGFPPIYENSWNGQSQTGNLFAAAAFRIGNSADPNGPEWDDGTALATIYRHGNFDYVTNTVKWDPANGDHSLPNSLYLSAKPVFFGSLPWPWVDPTGTTKLHTLPAKARFDGGTPIPPPTTFADVPALYWAYAYIEAVYQAGVTGGCATNPLRYCPESTVNRGQMAVFLLRAKEGGAYTPPACTTPTFTDVPCSNTFAPWIYELVRRSVTGGCATNPARYCPTNPVTRSQMAVLLLKTLEPAGYTPPPCASPTFTDVPCSYATAAWIYDLVARGITSGCGGGNYCPASNNTRAQMAVFLTRTFSLPLP